MRKCKLRLDAQVYETRKWKFCKRGKNVLAQAKRLLYNPRPKDTSVPRPTHFYGSVYGPSNVAVMFTWSILFCWHVKV